MFQGSSYTKTKGAFMATTPKALSYEEWLELPEACSVEIMLLKD